jgi:hypothetical protein
MDWMQFATFMIGNMVFTLSLWFWNSFESRTDMRAIVALISSINAEIKDFHGRLCAIEERNRK